jgi:hypothetical protein
MQIRWTTGLAAGLLAALIALPAAAGPAKVGYTAKTTAAKKATTKTAERSVWPAETLSGQIMMVVPKDRLLIVKDSHGTAFDFVVAKSTHIRMGDKNVKLSDLSSDTNKSVSVKFVPERKGDIARTVKITS